MTGGSARRGRWRVAARIARRDARRHRGRTALVVALAGLPVAAGCAVAVLAQSATPTPTTVMRWELGEEAQALVGSPGFPHLAQDELGSNQRGATFFDGATTPPGASLDAYEREVRAALPAGDELVLSVQAMASVTPAGGGSVVTVGLEDLPAARLPGVASLSAGRLPTSPTEVALTRRDAAELGVGPGDVVLATTDGVTRPLTVTGLLAPAARGPSAVVAPGSLPAPADAWPHVGNSWSAAPVRWWVLGPEPVTWDDVRAVNEIGSTVLSRAVVLDPPPRDQMPYYSTPEPAGPRNLAMPALIGVIGVLEVVLLIGPAFAVGARRSQRQLAMLAAVGADRPTLRASVLLVGLVTGAGAAVAGATAGVVVAAAVVLSARLRSSFWLPELRVPWPAVLGIAGLGLLVTTAAAWFPARSAARVDVVAALGGRRADARGRRRVPLVAAAVAVLGAGATALGGWRGLTPAVVAGVALLELGLVAGAGGAVAAVARLAPRLRIGPRLALRDAARHRSRTAPAVAAVLAATAGAMAGLVYLTSEVTREASGYEPAAARGAVLVTYQRPPSDDQVARAIEGLRAALPVEDLAVVRLAVPAMSGGSYRLEVADAPGRACPSRSAGGPVSLAQLRAEADDPRCLGRRGWSMTTWADETSSLSLVVDDGTTLRALGLPQSEAAARALESGRALVQASALWPDGTAELRIVDNGDPTLTLAPLHQDGAATAGEPATDATRAAADGAVRLPAADVGLLGGTYGTVVPPSALPALGLTSRVGGIVVRVSRDLTPAEEAAAGAVVAEHGGGWLMREEGPPVPRLGVATLAIVGGATVVGLVATGIAVALAAADSVPDLATLSAVGAPPRTRRRFAASQAGVVAGLGAFLGVALGVVQGWALVQMHLVQTMDVAVRAIVPWWAVLATVVGVPLAAMALGWLTSRSRLPMVRRLAA